MNDSERRPDPDTLLDQINEDERAAAHGHLTVFFGFAPGVGKTYRMLQVARELVADKKRNLVIGLVETHQRAETAALIEGLEVLPRRTVLYRGQTLNDFDIDAALACGASLILVDELAHTNAPGSRHAKRWQDVVELLHQGIDVFTTMNVQHVESLNDIVAQLTRVRVRETVPDMVLDQAESIEIVDISPRELLQRLQDGKVYLPEQAKAAMAHFFQRGQLLALRELALRRTAQRVDADVQDFRARHGMSATWPAVERLLVCVGAAPSSARLVRSTARMAAGLRCTWIAAYVDDATLAANAGVARETLEGHLRLAESLGATVVRLAGGRVSVSLLDYARRHNVTRLTLGKPTHSRLRDFVRGSVLDEVVRGSGDIDVHVIDGDDDSGRRAVDPNAGLKPRDRSWNFIQYGYAAAVVGLTLLVAILLQRTTHLPDPEMLFLLAVMVVATRAGRGPALVSAALGIACYDFFFIAPTYTFNVDDRRYILTFAMMFGVGIVLSELTERLKRQEREARAREERTATLYALTKDLGAASRLEQIAEITHRHAAMSFLAETDIFFKSDAGVLVRASTPRGPLGLNPKEAQVATWVLEHGEYAGKGTDTLATASRLCAPLSVGSSVLGVLTLRFDNQAKLYAEQRAFLEVFCREVAVALERRLRAFETHRGVA